MRKVKRKEGKSTICGWKEFTLLSPLHVPTIIESKEGNQRRKRRKKEIKEEERGGRRKSKKKKRRMESKLCSFISHFQIYTAVVWQQLLKKGAFSQRLTGWARRGERKGGEEESGAEGIEGEDKLKEKEQKIS
ncbi:hypothetical protein M8J77_021062 [Diaphorina citri]|nr:hypothetical protein M8J77_021062 [Diaphorina citri]